MGTEKTKLIERDKLANAKVRIVTDGTELGTHIFSAETNQEILGTYSLCVNLKMNDHKFYTLYAEQEKMPKDEEDRMVEKGERLNLFCFMVKDGSINQGGWKTTKCLQEKNESIRS